METNEDTEVLNPPAVPAQRAANSPQGWRPGAVETRISARAVAPRTYDPSARTVEAVFATGHRVRRWFGWEELALHDEAVNLQRVALGQCRLLDHHNQHERGAVLGWVTEARIENGALIGTIRFADNEASRAAENDVRSGLLSGISVGYRINRLVLAEMDEEDDDIYRAEDWELLEVSLVSVPADPNAAIRSLEVHPHPQPENPGQTGHHEETTMEKTIETPAAAPEIELAASEVRSEPVQDTGEVVQAVTSALRAERDRIATIQQIARRASVPADQVDHAIAEDVSVDAFRQIAFDRMADEAASRSLSAIPHVTRGGLDETETRRAAMINSLLHRSDPGHVPLEDPAREYRGLSLIELARDCLEVSGNRTRGLSRSEIATRAFHSTSDFPFILENVATKSLRAAYTAYPRTFMAFCRQITAFDFKAQYRVQLGEAPQLEKVNEAGEFKRGTIKEGRQSIKVDTYGKVVGITRQTIINDDLGAFTRIPGMFGTSIATLESDLVWQLIISNSTLADSVALFHATHKNLVNPGVALSVDAISTTRTLMRKQKGLDGKTTINVTPRYLVVPSELETSAEQIINSTITPGESSKVVPASMRSLNVIVEPRLSDASATAFYLAADPATIDTIEYAYLEGQEGAYIETRQGFDVDGLEVKCRLDFGAAVIDHRGFARNPGA